MVIELWFGDFSWWFDWNLIGFHRDFIGIFYGIFYVLNSWGIPWRHHGFFKKQIIQWSDWMIWDTPMTSDTYIYGNILYTWWLIPRLVFVGHNPSYFSGLTRSLSHVNHWGYNPLTSRGMSHQVYIYIVFGKHGGFYLIYDTRWCLFSCNNWL